MKRLTEPREASPRASEGDRALLSPSRGRSAAPHLSIWLPIAAKVAAAAGAIVVLALIGAKAGAHGSAPGDPVPSTTPPSATPPVLAAAFLPALPSMLVIGDGGRADPPPAATDAPSPAETASPSGAGLLADGRVVLNIASEAELTKLPGIGPSRARAILALRQRLTKFRAVEDLLRIKGIGRKMLRRLRPNVVLDRPSTDTHAGPSPPPPASAAVSSTASPSAEDSDGVDR